MSDNAKAKAMIGYHCTFYLDLDVLEDAYLSLLAERKMTEVEYRKNMRELAELKKAGPDWEHFHRKYDERMRDNGHEPVSQED